MKKKLLLVLVLGWVCSAAMAQDGAKKLLTDPELQAIGQLKDLADQIVKAETAAGTTSRSNAAEAKEKVAALYATYEKELQNQKNIHAKEAATVTAIDNELSLLNTKK